jgi:hypothetical protein
MVTGTFAGIGRIHKFAVERIRRLRFSSRTGQAALPFVGILVFGSSLDVGAWMLDVGWRGWVSEKKIVLKSVKQC